MTAPLLLAALLVAVTVAIHAFGLALLLAVFKRSPLPGWTSAAWLLIRVAWLLVLIHALEIAIWGSFYWIAGRFPDLESALYFSASSYTTIGYGDLVLTEHWRLLGPLEGLTGILMCGLSAGWFVAIVSRIVSAMNPAQE